MRHHIAMTAPTHATGVAARPRLVWQVGEAGNSFRAEPRCGLEAVRDASQSAMTVSPYSTEGNITLTGIGVLNGSPGRIRVRAAKTLYLAAGNEF